MKLVARKNIDIGAADLARALGSCLLPWGGTREQDVEELFCPDSDAHVSLSVRTSFDLILQAIELRDGDEVMMSGFTIPHMPQLVRLHGGVPVPIDLDPNTMTPDWSQMQSLVSPRTRAIVLAHLFGARFDSGPAVALAAEHGLIVVEDAAQAFDNGPWRGHPRADVALFSFGGIKTSTALGGGIAVVRNPLVAARMRALNATYRRRSNLSFAVKVAKYLLLLGLLHPRVYGLAAMLCAAVEIDFDAAINAVTRSFQGGDLLAAIRYRPARTQLRLLLRRLSQSEGSRAATRAALGARVAEALPARIRLLGRDGARHSHWLFPVVSHDPVALVSDLRRGGFDATRGGTTLAPVRAVGRTAPKVESLFRNIVYLPVDGHLNAGDAARLIRLLHDFANRSSPPASPPASAHLSVEVEDSGAGDNHADGPAVLRAARSGPE